MLGLSCRVTIEGVRRSWDFATVCGCIITEDTDSLTDTCVIEFPNGVKWDGSVADWGLDAPILRGDKVRVMLGYNDDLKVRFRGYVRRVVYGFPIRIECDDMMYLLKLHSAEKRGFRGATVEKVVRFLLRGSGVRCELLDGDVSLGPYRITRDTVAEELWELRRSYGLMSYFRDWRGNPRLYVGFGYPFGGRKVGSFVHGHNIISSSLEYRREVDVRLRVKAVGVCADNRRIEVEAGDKDGELRTVYKHNVKESDLKVFAASELERFKYSGYQGSFETFGEPAVSKTDIAHVEGEDGNKGDFLIKKVETTFGTGGYRQKVELGPVISG